MKKIKLNISREENNLHNNIYYVCDKNILLSKLSLTINYNPNHLKTEETIEENINEYEIKEKKKNINIKIIYTDDEFNSLYFNDIVNNLYNYIWKYKSNDLNLGKNNDWYIFINIYVYDYSPYVYEHIINVINVHLSVLLIPLCFYDFDEQWFRCIESYDELYSLINYNSVNNNEIKKENENIINNNIINDNDKIKNNCINETKTEGINEMFNFVILDKYEQNKNIIIDQIKNCNFSLSLEIKKDDIMGIFKRIFFNCIPLLVTVIYDEQYIHVIKFINYKDFFLKTQQNTYHNFKNKFQKQSIFNFNDLNTFEDTYDNIRKDFELNENFYILFNVNCINVDKEKIKNITKPLFEFYYNFIFDYCVKYFYQNYLYTN